MRRSLRFALLGVLLAALTGTAWGYVLMDPFQRVGDPDLPFQYHIHYDLDEPSIEGDREFEIVKESFWNWQHQPENVDLNFIEKDPAVDCGIHNNGLSEVSFQDCQNLCGSGVLGVTYSLRTAQGDVFWTTGTDSLFAAKLESDFVYCKGWNWDDPEQDWNPCQGGNRFDTGGVGTHEIGHMLGLGHSQFGLATMFYAIAPCDSTKRSLYLDDKRATRVLYRNRELLQVGDHDNFNGVFSIMNTANLAWTGAGGWGGNAGQWGNGFVWPSGGNNHIFECSMALGVVNSRVSDNFRTDGEAAEDEDFIQKYSVQLHDKGTHQTGFGIWDDSQNDQPPYGIRVLMRSYSFPNPPDDDYVIVCYWLVNETGSVINNLRVGMFTDFDLDGTYVDNSVDYEAGLGLGYATDPSTTIEAGWKVLNPEGVVTYRALYATDQSPSEVYTDANKTTWFNSGFTRTSLGPADIAQLIVTGNFSIAPGDTAHAAFAIIGGSNHADLMTNAVAAQTKYDGMEKDPGVSGVEESIVRLPISLSQNAPNPFSPTTRISFSLQERTDVSLIVADPSGRLVRTLVAQPLNKGHHNYTWDGRDDKGRAVSAGVYFYYLNTDKGKASKKMVLTR
jgi:hypothetical protein